MHIKDIKAHLEESARVKNASSEQAPLIAQIAESLVQVIKAGGRIYACGNGGSTCDAMHFTEELVARYDKKRPGIPAQHLCDAGAITCWANDYSFDTVFRRQVETLICSKDALVAFSTSGSSPNIIEAITAANSLGALTVGLLGKDGGKAKELCKLPLVVPSDVTAHIQEAHITIVHILCGFLENSLFPGQEN